MKIDVEIELGAKASTALEQIISELKLANQQLTVLLHNYNSDLEPIPEEEQLQMPREPKDIREPENVPDNGWWRLDLISLQSYNREGFETVTKEMKDWLEAHGKETRDIQWCGINQFTGSGAAEARFVGRLLNVDISQLELTELMTERDNWLLNICGHPWYIGSHSQYRGTR